MVDEANRKNLRQFSCREHLWDSFEQLSEELECSVDYLINEAMRHYLRAQGRGAASRGAPGPNDPGSSPPGRPPMGPTGAGPTTRPVQRTIPPMPGVRPATAPIASAQQQPQRGAPATMPPMPGARPPAGVPARPRVPAPAAAPTPMQAPMPAPARQPQPPVSAPVPPPSQPPTAAAMQVLYAVYGNDEVPVTKDEFWIGRGHKVCDLVIRDTNISRQHARVVRHNGQYWIVDNESTNGVEFRGAKIQQKRLDDGDVFTLCGHDVQFVYR